MVKAVKSKTKICWNNLKQIKTAKYNSLRFSEIQPVDFSKQPVESVWQQSQNKDKLFQAILKTLSVKQPVDLTFQPV